MQLARRTWLLLVAVAQLLACEEASDPATRARCAVSWLQTEAPGDTVVTLAERKREPVAHCLVEGFVTTNDPAPNRNGFRLQLPDQFAGRYYFIGLGGSAGALPSESQSPPGNPIPQGFAVAGTDTGHEGSYLDWSFAYRNRAKALDHNDRGAHVTAQATQQLTKAYYGVESLHRYHSGCSGGGRMGAAAVALHPEDYDGVLAGAPALSTASILLYLWIAQHLAKSPAHTLSAETLAWLEERVLAACDASDGVVDDMIWDPRRCDFDPASLACSSGEDGPCLSAAQLETLAAIQSGPHSPAGPIYPGLQLSNATGFDAWFPEAYARVAHSIARAYFGPSFDFMAEFDFADQADVDAWWRAAEAIGFGTRTPADYGAFERSGGKVIFWQGMSDPGNSLLDQVSYFEEVRAHTGDDARFRDFAAMYLVPGALHCGGGTGPTDVADRLLETLIAWVERGEPPGPVVTQRGREARLFPVGAPSIVRSPPGLAPREFLLCPYPQQARFAGDAAKESEIADASRWACAEN